MGVEALHTTWHPTKIPWGGCGSWGGPRAVRPKAVPPNGYKLTSGFIQIGRVRPTVRPSLRWIPSLILLPGPAQCETPPVKRKGRDWESSLRWGQFLTLCFFMALVRQFTTSVSWTPRTLNFFVHESRTPWRKNSDPAKAKKALGSENELQEFYARSAPCLPHLSPPPSLF